MGERSTWSTPPADQSQIQSNFSYFLALPNGQVLVNERIGSRNIFVYNAGGTADVNWLPQIDYVSSSLIISKSYTLKGQQLSGLTEGSFYGDDCNNQTNYPLIKITNQKSLDVIYARTFGATSTSIAPFSPLRCNSLFSQVPKLCSLLCR